MAQENFPDIYIDESVSPGGVGSLADPYSDFSEINWSTGGDNSVYDYYNNTPTASVTINEKRSEEWRQQMIVGASGTATYPIVVQAYGAGNDPIISGMREVTGWSTPGNWSEDLSTENKTLATMDTDWDPANIESWFRNEVLANTMDNNGTQIRLKLKAHTTANSVITGVSVGEQHAVNGEDYSSAPTRITFDTGNPGVTITAGGEKWTDWVDYIWTRANDQLIHVTVDALSGDLNIRLKIAGNVSWRELAGGDETMTQDVDGTDQQAHFVFVEEIEIKFGTPNIWILDLATDPQRLVIDGTEYLEAKTAGGVNSTYRWFYDSGGTTLYLYATENPATAYSTMDYSANTACMKMDTKSYITIQDLEFQGGIWCVEVINASSNILIHDCTVGKWAYLAGIRVRGMTGAPYTQITDVEIYDNVVDSHYHNSGYDRSSFQDGIWLGDSVINSKVYGNTVIDWSHSGIVIICTVANCETQFNEIYQNSVSAPNSNYGRGIDFSDNGVDGQCAYNKAYRNLIFDVGVRSQPLGDHNEFYYNITYNVTQRARTAGVPGGVGLFASTATKNCHDNKVDNNIFYNIEHNGIMLDGFAGWSDVENNLVRNNIVMNWGVGRYGIFVTDHATVKGNTYQNNCLYKSGVSDVVWYRGVPRTITEFNAEHGGPEGDVIQNNIEGDPKFVNPGSYDFHLAADSPCRNVGIDVGLSEDYDGVSVPQETNPAIGAFEFIGVINLFEDFKERWGKGIHQFHSGGHTLKIYLTNNAPDAAADSIKADLVGITEENGYAPADIQNDYTESGGVGTLTGVDVTFEAQGGSFGPFRYAILYNDTPTSPADPLIGWYDFGSEITCLDTQTFKVDFGTKILDVG